MLRNAFQGIQQNLNRCFIYFLCVSSALLAQTKKIFIPEIKIFNDIEIRKVIKIYLLSFFYLKKKYFVCIYSILIYEYIYTAIYYLKIMFLKRTNLTIFDNRNRQGYEEQSFNVLYFLIANLLLTQVLCFLQLF